MRSASGGRPQPPSSSLPPLRNLDALPEEQVFAALQSLSTLYRPLPTSLGCSSSTSSSSPVSMKKRLSNALAPPLADSGYVSAAEDGGDSEGGLSLGQEIAALRADGFERSFSERWLTGFLSRAEGLSCFGSEESRQRALDQASGILESFYAPVAATGDVGDGFLEDEAELEPDLYAREFSFDVRLPLQSSLPSLSSSGAAAAQTPVTVRLNDGLSGQDSSDPDDVGLQSWSGAIVLSELICADPARFGLGPERPSCGFSDAGSNAPLRIVELGAGTGLVSLVLAALLPRLGDSCASASSAKIVATDYHPGVLANLRANIDLNSSNIPPAAAQAQTQTPLEACLLDWSTPNLTGPLDGPVDLLFATDVIYAPEHAIWLRDCASRMLQPDGTFWMLSTIRQKGRFEGISETVAAAFAAPARERLGGKGGVDGRRLVITHSEKIEKRKGLGRGDESGHFLYKIEWA